MSICEIVDGKSSMWVRSVYVCVCVRVRERETETERERPVTDDAALNHAANLLGAWERRFTSLDVCFDNYKTKA